MKLKSYILMSLVTSLLFASALCESANAGFMLTFGTTANPTPGSVNSQTINVGEFIDVSVYVTQTDTENRLVNSGLISVGTKALFAPTFGSVSNITINAQFDQFTDTAFDNVVGSLNLAGTAAPGDSVNGGSVLVGTFRFTASSAGNTMFSFGDFTPSDTFSDFGLASIEDIDPLLFGIDRNTTHSFTVQSITAVPEPSSIGLCLVAASLFQMRRIFKNRKVRVRT